MGVDELREWEEVLAKDGVLGVSLKQKFHFIWPKDWERWTNYADQDPKTMRTTHSALNFQQGNSAAFRSYVTGPT